MTISKELKRTEINGKTVVAYENLEKFSSVPYYEIITIKNGMIYDVTKTARTTWKKKFNELAK